MVYARVMRGILLLGSAQLDEVERTATLTLAEAESLGAAPVAAIARSLAALVALFREDGRWRSNDSPTASPPEPDRGDSRPILPGRDLVHAARPGRRIAVPVFEESWLLGRRVGAQQGHAYALSAPETPIGSRGIWTTPSTRYVSRSRRSPGSMTRRGWPTLSTIWGASSATGDRSNPQTVICARRCGSASSSGIAAVRT